MKALVTGGRGHIGGAVYRHLVALGWEVVTVSRMGDIRVDLGDPAFIDVVATALPRCDAVVHCAASMAKGLTETTLSRVNGVGTQNVIAAAARMGARNLVYISSLPVIGRPIRRPVDEDHPTNPLSAYHASKLYGEHLMRLASTPTLRTTTLRITSPIGPGTPRGRIFSEFVARAHHDEPLVLTGKGGRCQDYVDVRDIADAVTLAITVGAGGIFNIASGRAISNLELATRCIHLVGTRAEITFSGTPDPDEGLSWDVSVEKARRVLGYAPARDVDESIRALSATL